MSSSASESRCAMPQLRNICAATLAKNFSSLIDLTAVVKSENAIPPATLPDTLIESPLAIKSAPNALPLAQILDALPKEVLQAIFMHLSPYHLFLVQKYVEDEHFQKSKKFGRMPTDIENSHRLTTTELEHLINQWYHNDPQANLDVYEEIWLIANDCWRNNLPENWPKMKFHLTSLEHVTAIDWRVMYWEKYIQDAINSLINCALIPTTSTLISSTPMLLIDTTLAIIPFCSFHPIGYKIQRSDRTLDNKSWISCIPFKCINAHAGIIPSLEWLIDNCIGNYCDCLRLPNFACEHPELLNFLLRLKTLSYVEIRNLRPEGTPMARQIIMKHPALEDISFFFAQLPDSDAQSILEALAGASDKETRWKKLQFCAFSLSSSSLIPTLCDVIKRSPSLSIFRLLSNRLSDRDAATIISTVLQNKTVKSLEINDQNLGMEAVKAFKEYLNESSVETLSLGNNNFDEESGREMMKILTENTKIISLDFSDNPLEREGGNSLASMLEVNTTLQRLNIGDCTIIANEKLTQALCKNSTLKELIVQKNLFGREAATLWATVIMNNRSLTVLDLSCINLGVTTGFPHVFCNALHGSPLRKLTLKSDQITNDGGVVLAQALGKTQYPLESLVLSYNPLNEKTTDAIIQTLKETNRKLDALFLPTDCLGPENEQEKRKALLSTYVHNYYFVFFGGIFDGLQEV